MNSDWLPAVSALLGAVIGAAATAIPAYYQMRIQARTQRTTEAMRFGLEYNRTLVAHLRDINKGVLMPRPELILFSMAELAREIEKGPLTVERMVAFHRRQNELIKAMNEEWANGKE